MLFVSIPESKNKEREEIERQLDEFLAAGNVVTECPPCTYSDGATHNDEGEIIE